MSHPAHFFPVTNTNVLEVYEQTFPVWTKALGLCDLRVDGVQVRALLPAAPALKLSTGFLSGQAIMAAIDTLAAIAAATSERAPRGTIYLHNHFLRPAAEALLIKAEVLRFGRSAAFVEVRATDAATGELIAHASTEVAL
jgi:acyl-coenzyme A thioesterase PaaI-like protein